MLEPDCEWTKFASDDEKLEKYREWGFIAPKQKWLKTLFYCGIFCDTPSVCDIVGYINDFMIVIKVNDKLHTIQPNYLLQMQNASPTAYPDKYIVLDLETTGFSPNKDKILEIAAIKYQQSTELEIFHTMINPNCGLNPLAKSVNHIDSSMICDAPCIEDILPKFIDFLGDLPLVAHNATFDLGFLRKEAQAEDLKILNTVFDTAKLAREAFPNLTNYKLQTIIKELNIKIEDSHRALPDTQATAIIFQKCLQILYPAVKFISTAEQVE
ncbi:3'-5' exonuclease [Caproiciproducens sp.]